MDERNTLIDSPADVDDIQTDQRLVAAWLASLRPEEVPWWADIPEVFAEEVAREDAFHQALKLTISSTR